MFTTKKGQFSLKAVMIKGSNKVLYAEIDRDFADVVLSFLTLPLGTIVRLFLKSHGNNAPIIGSLNSLYAGLLNLDGCHFGTEEGKLMLLNPRNASGFECKRLKLQIDDTPLIKYFTCQRQECVSIYYHPMRCLCPDSTIKEIWNDFQILPQSGDGSTVFTAQTTSFILTDDLEILINSPASIFQILKRNFIDDIDVLEEKPLMVGLKVIMELLKASLVSKTPITDIVLPTKSLANALDEKTAHTLDEKMKSIAPANYESTQTSRNISSDSKKITVKAFVQKSTSRVLLAQSRHDFIDFLFSFLTFPLGRVQSLLGDNTCLGSIRNLYRSISNPETVKYMKSKEAITRLLEPELPPFYLSSHQIFFVIPPSFSFPNTEDITRLGLKPVMNWIDPKGQGSFVKEVPTVLFVVTDDLVVSTPSSTSIISTLNQMKIPLSDIEEQVLGIGMEEALSILQASLTSTYALTNGLKPFLKRQPEQEK